MAVISNRLISRLYQFTHMSCGFLFVALLIRWLILLPLVGSKFLPGVIHEFLCYLLVYSSVSELIWLLKFRGFIKTFSTRTFMKDLNFLYFVLVMHYYDDYEHAPVLKNASYSSFIIGVAFTQAYSHCNSLFKRSTLVGRGTIWKADTYFMMPLLYLSEMYLLLLNLRNPSFHTFPLLDKLNRVVLVIFLPVALSLYGYQLRA